MTPHATTERSLDSSIDLRSDRRCSSSGPVNQTWVFFIAPMTCRLDRKKPAPKHSDGFHNSSGKGVEHDHRLCESLDNGAES